MSSFLQSHTGMILKKVFKRVFEYFLQGLLYLSPIGITIWVTLGVASFIDESVQPAIDKIFSIRIPGLGLILIFIVITLAGLIGHSFFITQLRLLIRKGIKKAPLFETIYSSVKDFVSAFVGKERKFTKPALVKINTVTNIEKIGFITQEDLATLKIKDKVAVYMPYSYSFMGELYIVPAEHVTPLDISPTDAMKFVVSGGVTTINNVES